MTPDDSAPAAGAQQPGEISKNVVLFIAAISSFLTPFTASSVNIALPAINRELAMSAVSLGWVATAYVLAAAMFLVPFGRIADIKGRKRVFLYGMAVDTAAVAFLLSLYLQCIKGFSAEHAGMILITQPVLMIVCSPLAGTLSDRIEPAVIASIARGRVRPSTLETPHQT